LQIVDTPAHLGDQDNVNLDDGNADNETVPEQAPTAQLRSLVTQRANSGVASTLAASADESNDEVPFLTPTYTATLEAAAAA
jgi:hypothetical protein